MAPDAIDIVSVVRILMMATALVCSVAFWRGLVAGRSAAADKRFRSYAATWMIGAAAAAFVVSHTGLLGTGAQYLPHGVAVGFVVAIGSLFSRRAREAFDRLSDSDVRFLMSFRMVFGAFLYAGAGIGLFPLVFALTAGTGDLLAGWLATIAPSRLDSGGPSGWRWVVHGWGAIDLVDVAVLGTFVVRPWLLEHGSLGPSLLLPWVAVPLLFALNLHGLSRVSADQRKGADAASIVPT
ncbi:MAG: hypothetical protein R3B72_38920 [Polyangiaceae bacterium]